MSIKLLNTELELKSFPATQSIKLHSTIKLEETVLKDSIILFRLQTENVLVNLAEPYSYNLGHLKETYDTIPLTFSITKLSDGFEIICTPKQPLPLDSVFNLYIKDDIPSESIVVEKITSKTTSSIVVNPVNKIYSSQTVIVKVVTTSSLKDGKNVTTFSIDGTEISLNLKSKSKYIYKDIEISFLDTIYVKDEEFIIGIEVPLLSDGEYHHYIRTVNSNTITPIETKEASSRLSNKDILDFYKTLSTNTKVTNVITIPKYLSENVFSILLPEDFKLDLSDTSLFIGQLTVAFNNYLLKSIDMYDDSLKYKVLLYKDFMEGREIIFEVIFSEDVTQVDKVVFDLTGVM